MTYAAEVLADGPRAYYRLGESSGTNMLDASGNARHGAYQNAPTLGAAGALAGDADTAVLFNATTQRALVTYDGAWMLPTDFTLEAWVKTTATGGTILSRNVVQTPWRIGVSGGKAFLEIRTGSSELFTGTTTVNNGNWHHIAATYEGGTGRWRLYVNGVQEGTGIKASGFSPISQPGAAMSVNARSGDSYLGGTIDEVAFYGTALSAGRVLAHYAAGTAVPSNDRTATLAATGLGFAASHSGTATLPLSAVVNLEPQPSIETSENWGATSGGDNPVPSTDRAWVGTKSLKITRGAGTGQTIARRTSANYTTTVLDGAGTYRHTVRLWVDPAITGDVALRMAGTGITGAPIIDYVTERGEWAEASVVFTWDGVGTASLDVMDYAVTSGALVYLDGSIATKGSAYVPYFDGDTDDAVWLGTPHDSRSARAAQVAGDLTATGLTFTAAATGDVAEPVSNALTATGLGFSASLEGELSPATDTGNRAGGRQRAGTGQAVWEPAVAPTPEALAHALAYDVAAAFSEPTLLHGTQPTYEVTTAAVPRTRTRIVVAGKDVTYFRGIPTPSPSYQLIAPLLYGPATLALPQVAGTFEQPGVGALRWLRKGAPVTVQRVDADGNVVATDYRGVVIAFNMDGRGLSVEVGGQASGRAALVNKQVPIFRAVRDVGHLAHDAIRSLGLRFTPRLGPDTGIGLARFGGMSMLDYLNELCAKAWTRDGNQWTVMPDDTGAYTMARKDTTTVHASVYLDDAWAVGSLRRDIAEEPNRIYMTGVSPEGRRLRNAVYPGLNQGNRPPYPMTDGSTFGLGTTDADTDTGDGITAMVRRLRAVKYLTREDAPGGYDTDVRRAVRALQDEAGLPETGVMDRPTWRALFDLSATGYSLRNSRILPMAQRSAVKEWHLTSSGALASRNPNYDPTVLPVDRNVNTGLGFTHDQLREWARAELGDGDNWVGTISLNTGAVVAGLHNPGDPLTAGDVLPARALRPGLNVWAPLFMGGTLFHVSGVSVAEDGGVSLAVDTRARDTMQVWQVIERNRESRQHPARAWINQHRSSTMTKDGLGEWDAAGGVIEAVRCDARRWTVFPVPVGQEGTIRSLRVRTDQPAEFVMAVFGRKVTRSWLAARVPAPLTVEGGKRWEREGVRKRLDERYLLYAAGTAEQPCGYSPGKKHHKEVEREQPNPDYDPATDPDSDKVVTVTETESWGRLTGKHEDDAGVSYHTFAEPVVYVAVWADRATTVQGGRIMWPQLEAGS